MANSSYSLHTGGFEQCASAYIREIGAPPDEIDAYRNYLDRVVHDDCVTVALFENTQYIARRA
jgi:hypothetical protein